MLGEWVEMLHIWDWAWDSALSEEGKGFEAMEPMQERAACNQCLQGPGRDRKRNLDGEMWAQV